MMATIRFQVCPPIESDSDYYRFDDEAVDRVLCGQSMLAVGIRRSGKTSFLKRIARAALAKGRGSEYLLLPELFYEGQPLRELRRTLDRIAAQPDALLLFDEAEAFHENDRAWLSRLLAASRRHTVVMTCAPLFILELPRYPKPVQDFVSTCQRHIIYPLREAEAVALLKRSKSETGGGLADDAVCQIMEYGDRLPIVLQAHGAERAEGIPISISLASVGREMLRGLTQEARRALIAAAHEAEVDTGSVDVQLLRDLGVLSASADGAVARIAGRTLTDLIRGASDPPNSKRTSTRTAELTKSWKRHARILHIADLHFGPHCIEYPDQLAAQRQLGRLKSALERDAVVPDFVVVAGDLSWAGRKREIADAEEFLEGLVEWLTKTAARREREARQSVLIIPGNHDAAWSLTSGLTGKDAKEWTRYGLAPFANMFNRFYRGRVLWDFDHPCQIRCFDEPSAAFVCMSTCHSITKKDPDGRFGDGLQEQVAEMLARSEFRNARFRLGVFHHNLRPFHGDGRAVQDGEGAILRFARFKPTFDLLLHGHVHQGEVDAFKPRAGLREIAYSAVGSFGVVAQHRPGDDAKGRIANEFAVIDLETSGTARRFSTQFYQLCITPTGDWAWITGSKSKPQTL